MDPIIVCAAIKNEHGTIVCGPRHYDAIMRSMVHEMSEAYTWTQGFVDQLGVFYTRTEAWKIAEANGQIRRRCGGDTVNGGTLYSENLY